MKKSKKIIVGNWKMDPVSATEAKSILTKIQTAVSRFKKTQVVICPPFVYLPYLAQFAKKKVAIGAQDVFYKSEGAFTGEVSADMLEGAGVTYVIVGHSERRKLGETDEIVNKKIILSLKSGLIPIICIGEEVRDEDGNYLAFIKSQIEQALAGVSKPKLNSIIIAYEPIWAIGTSMAMNARDIHEMMIYIKKVLVDMYKVRPPVVSTPILYGGAVDTGNAESILGDGETDGLLIGRQSLKADHFIEILKIAEILKQ